MSLKRVFQRAECGECDYVLTGDVPQSMRAIQDAMQVQHADSGHKLIRAQSLTVDDDDE